MEEYQAKLQERLTNLLADNNIKVEPERLLQEEQFLLTVPALRKKLSA